MCLSMSILKNGGIQVMNQTNYSDSRVRKNNLPKVISQILAKLIDDFVNDEHTY